MGSEKIALFGTSADPPTRGHQLLLEGLLSRYSQVATWASDNPMKQHGAALPLRASLLGALVNQIQDQRLQLVQDLSSPYTMNTLKQAAQRWPKQELVFVVGSDLAEQIPRWRESASWLPHCDLAIAPRQGWPLGSETLATLERLGSRLEVLDLVIPATASSLQRQAPEQAQIPASVWPLLLEHNLYGLSGSFC